MEPPPGPTHHRTLQTPLIATTRTDARSPAGGRGRGETWPRRSSGRGSHSLSQPARDGDGEARESVGPRADFRAPASDVRDGAARRRPESGDFSPDVKLHTPTGTRRARTLYRANHVDPAVPIGMQVYVVSKAVLVAMCTEHHP